MDRNNIRRLANVLDIEYDCDLCQLYAGVCNRSLSSPSDENLITLKREIEHYITLKYMDEYSWEQNEVGVWRYVSSEEFSARYRAAKEKSRSEREILPDYAKIEINQEDV